MKLKVLAILLVSLKTLAQSNVRTEHETPCPPVLIYQELGESTGAGFFVRDSVKWYLVTARHLLVDIKSGKLINEKCNLQVFSSDLTKDDRCNMTVNLKLALDSGRLHYNTKDDVVAVEMGSAGAKGLLLNSNGALTSSKVAEKNDVLKATSLSSIEDFKNVRWGEDIMLYGYPTSLGLKPLPQYDYDKPLLRAGVVAGKYVDRHTLVVDCQTFGGNSGAPVVKKTMDEDGKSKYVLVGIVTDYIPYFDRRMDLNEGKRTEETIYQNNSGYSVVVPMDVVAELVRSKK